MFKFHFVVIMILSFKGYDYLMGVFKVGFIFVVLTSVGRGEIVYFIDIYNVFNWLVKDFKGAEYI